MERTFFSLLDRVGPELHVLRHASCESIAEASTPSVAEAIRRMRSGDVRIHAGYDGEFGTVCLFTDEERSGEFVQLSFF